MEDFFFDNSGGKNNNFQSSTLKKLNINLNISVGNT